MMFEDLQRAIESVMPYVKQRIGEFKRLRDEGITHYDFRPFLKIELDADIFSELCFCLLTANSSASMGILLQKEIGIDGFKSMGLEELTQIISKHGHRFARQRAERIVKAREVFEDVLYLVRNARSGKEIRDLLSDPCSKYKVRGFGLKEASHFLRNIGFDDVAIVDRHILRYLKEKKIIPDQKTLTRRIYLTAEEKLAEICSELKLTQSELDLYIFYIKTKKVLK
jgi:N-glycosylase/DNA lyase